MMDPLVLDGRETVVIAIFAVYLAGLLMLRWRFCEPTRFPIR